MRRRGYNRVPLAPLAFGGGQERGLRPGTLPVPLIVALGKAAEVAVRDNAARKKGCASQRAKAVATLAAAGGRLTGDPSRVMEHVINIAFPGLDSEALIVALKGQVAISNGSACTSSSYQPSHVLKAMGMTDDEANECVRISWCHMTPEVDWAGIAKLVKSLL